MERFARAYCDWGENLRAGTCEGVAILSIGSNSIERVLEPIGEVADSAAVRIRERRNNADGTLSRVCDAPVGY